MHTAHGPDQLAVLNTCLLAGAASSPQSCRPHQTAVTHRPRNPAANGGLSHGTVQVPGISTSPFSCAGQERALVFLHHDHTKGTGSARTIFLVDRRTCLSDITDAGSAGGNQSLAPVKPKSRKPNAGTFQGNQPQVLTPVQPKVLKPNTGTFQGKQKVQ